MLMNRVISFILSAIIAFFSFFGLELRPVEIGNNTDVVCITNGKKEISGEFTLTFEKQKVNTAEIDFGSAGEASVKIYNGDECIYSRTGREAYRFCAFRTVETDSLRFIIDKKAKSLSLSYKTSCDEDFRITAYVVASNIKSKNNLCPEHFDIITDVILFGTTTFDENGNLSVNAEQLETALSLLRETIGDRKVNIYINILGPGADGGISDWNDQMNNLSAKHSKAFKNKALTSEIKALVDKYGFDGVFFDYEYPLEERYWNDFKRFLRKLDKKLDGDEKIGIAVSSWNLPVAGRITDCVDMVELMQYGMFDNNGEHSSFTRCVEGFTQSENAFLDRDELDMGVPFFARPQTRAARWPEYSTYAPLIGDNDGCDTSDGYSFFNCRQTIYDKTAYCLSRGIGGMMVWHYSCECLDWESGLSLFKVMQDCIDDRNIGEPAQHKGIC